MDVRYGLVTYDDLITIVIINLSIYLSVWVWVWVWVCVCVCVCVRVCAPLSPTEWNLPLCTSGAQNNDGHYISILGLFAVEHFPG